MAGYNYASRGGYIDDRNRASYGEDGYSSEHVCRPVIVDVEGRKRPIISYVSPNVSSESYVTTTTETIVEHVRAPIVLTDYNKYNSQAKIEPLKDYGVNNDKWSNPSNQVYDRTEYRYSSPPQREPMRSYGVTNDNWRSNPTKAEDFVKKVSTEVRRPTRPGLLSATQWRNTPISTGQGYGGSNDYGGQYANYNTNNSTPLSGIINEIGQATEILKDAVKPSSIPAVGLQSRSPILASTTVPRRDGSYTDTIDSREAAKRYGNVNLSSRPIQTGETYTGTIDSREAARRYNGARV